MDNNLGVAIKTDLPDNYLSMTNRDIVDYEEDLVPQYYTRAQRLSAVIKMYEALGYELTNDIKMALITEYDKQLLVALAGGCKTTTAVIKTILKLLTTKDLTPSKCLFLVYTNPNVKDIQDTYEYLASTINARVGTKIPVEQLIDVRTIHAFCKAWVETYAVAVGIQGKTIVQAEDRIVVNMMEGLIEKWAVKNLPGDDMATKKRIEDLVSKAGNFTSLYEYQLEKMLTDEELAEESEFKRLKLSVDDYANLKKRYERGLANRLKITKYVDGEKVVSSGYTFAQLLTWFRDLVKEREDIRERIVYNFQYLVVDEVQDLSPLMMDLFRCLLKKDNQALFIGDDDQSIYGYRGASPEVILNFKEIFNDSNCVVQSLTKNRRCPKNIVDVAKAVIELNGSDRYAKSMETEDRYGNITLIPYEDELSQNLMLIDKIKELEDWEERDITICYRNNFSGEIIADLLKDSDIPYNTGKVAKHQPFSYYLFKDLYSLLGMCYNPEATKGLGNIWMCTPLKRQEVYAILDLSDNGQIVQGKNYSLQNMPVSEFSNKPGFVKAYSTLLDISKRIKSEPLKNFVAPLIDLILKYRYVGKVPNNHDYFVSSVKKFFLVDKTFRELIKDINDIISRHSNWANRAVGTRFSTFHGLKGLGFNEVIMIDMANDIFPNDSLEGVASISPTALKKIKQENNRLFYVALTRTKQNLTIYYDKNNPSRYIDIIKKADTNPLNKGVLTEFLGSLLENEYVDMKDYSNEELTLLEDNELLYNLDTVVIEEPSIDREPAPIQNSELSSFTPSNDFAIAEAVEEIKVTNKRWNKGKFGARFK